MCKIKNTDCHKAVGVRKKERKNESSWYEYVYRLEKIPSNTMLNVKRYDGKSFFVNTAYVVNAENYKLVITELDISAWASRTNKIIEETTEKYFSLIEDDEYVTLV